MKEAGVVLDHCGQPIYWHSPPDRTVAYLPDSRLLWDVIWENRKEISGIAHSHPGGGQPGPSYEDVTTFAAVEAALGKRLDWWITSSDAVSLVLWQGPDRLTYRATSVPVEPGWVGQLRELSNVNGGNHA
jgi:hypothetical protein